MWVLVTFEPISIYTFIYKYKCTLITFQRYLLVLYYYATNDYAAYMQSPSHFAIAYRSLFPVTQHTLTWYLYIYINVYFTSFWNPSLFTFYRITLHYIQRNPIDFFSKPDPNHRLHSRCTCVPLTVVFSVVLYVIRTGSKIGTTIHFILHHFRFVT